MNQVVVLEPAAANPLAVAIGGGPCTNDDEAIRAFLAGYGTHSPHTQRSYAKEVKRFVLWLRYTAPGNPRLLPTVSPATISAFVEFLGRPTPFPASFLLEQGLPIQSARRNEAGRVPQPFGAGLSVRSRAHSLAVLRRLFDVLSNTPGPGGGPYCPFNPFRVMRPISSNAIHSSMTPLERGFTFDEWTYVLQAVDTPQTRTQARRRWFVMLLYLAFLRREEAARLTMGDFTPSRSGGWSLHVLGKGGARRSIVASTALMKELAAWRKFLGKGPVPLLNEHEPVICNAWGTDSATDDTLYREIRTVLRSAAEAALAAGDERAAQRLQRGSPHWLRHTGISHAMELGVDHRYVQAQAGHASLATTGLYDHKDRALWESSFEKLQIGSRPSPF